MEISIRLLGAMNKTSQKILTGNVFTEIKYFQNIRPGLPCLYALLQDKAKSPKIPIVDVYHENNILTLKLSKKSKGKPLFTLFYNQTPPKMKLCSFAIIHLN